VESAQRLRAVQRLRCEMAIILAQNDYGESRNMSVRLLGQELDSPILLAPTAAHKLMHPEGELSVTRAATATKTTFMVGLLSSTTIEDIAKAAPSSLYIRQDRA
jgi:isopentenyl diphosphate isomerase/L-lactate dehydrogenase-like FMN-dependent dehydrogenase